MFSNVLENVRHAMEYFTDFNTKIVKRCLASTGANAPWQKIEIEKKNLVK